MEGGALEFPEYETNRVLPGQPIIARWQLAVFHKKLVVGNVNRVQVYLV